MISRCCLVPVSKYADLTPTIADGTILDANTSALGKSSTFRSVTSDRRKLGYGTIFSYTSLQFKSKSTANTTSQPALSNPRDLPPISDIKSITLNLFILLLQNSSLNPVDKTLQSLPLSLVFCGDMHHNP